VHAWLQEQSWANKARLVLVGQSVGGLSTVAGCSQGLPGVLGCVNFAGGSGGNPQDSPGKSCQPERLQQQFALLGKTTSTPSLWLYAENDLYWGADAPKQWHKAFINAQQAAGHANAAELVMTPPIEGGDGHTLLRVGGKFWGPVLNAWLKKNAL
jgi:dienelactone hydrolase